MSGDFFYREKNPHTWPSYVTHAETGCGWGVYYHSMAHLCQQRECQRHTYYRGSEDNHYFIPPDISTYLDVLRIPLPPVGFTSPADATPYILGLLITVAGICDAQNILTHSLFRRL